MDAKGVVVPPGQGSVWNMAPGRSATLKLQSSETADSVMMFEEAASAGTVTNYHFHRDSDEVAYVLSGEVTFKIGDQISVGGPAHAPSYHAASRTPGRAPEPKRGGCFSSSRRLRPGRRSRSYNDCSAQLDRRRLQFFSATAPRLWDLRPSEFEVVTPIDPGCLASSFQASRQARRTGGTPDLRMGSN